MSLFVNIILFYNSIYKRMKIKPIIKTGEKQQGKKLQSPFGFEVKSFLHSEN